MRARPFRQTLAVATSLAFALATASPGPARAAAVGAKAPPPPPPPVYDGPPPPGHDAAGHPQRSHGLSTGEQIGIGAGVLILGCALFCPKHHEPKETRAPDDNDDAPDARDLLENGPHVSETLPMGAYAVYGFVRQGWPIVLDYDSVEGSRVWVTVGVYGHKPWGAKLEPGRHVTVLRYDGEGADKATPALFTVQSATSVEGKAAPSKLVIRGMGAGPQAVGVAPGVVGFIGIGPTAPAVAIDTLKFALATYRANSNFAEFGYRTTSLFHQVGMEILRYGADARGPTPLITVETARGYREQSLRPGFYGPRSWDGVDEKSRTVSHGPHRLQVRGWEVSGEPGWVTALSDDQVVAP